MYVGAAAAATVALKHHLLLSLTSRTSRLHADIAAAICLVSEDQTLYHALWVVIDAIKDNALADYKLYLLSGALIRCYDDLERAACGSLLYA